MPPSSEPPLGSREQRIAANEDWCRNLNERKAEWMKRGQLAAGFRCECWQLDCGDRIGLSVGEWNEIRSRPNRFAVAPGHIAAEYEAVIAKHPDFWVIEKHGEAGEAAKAMD